MPQQSDAQVIGDQGERWFESQLPPRWLPQRPTYDVGVDRVIVVCEESDINGLEFRVQVKAARRLSVRNNLVILNGIKRSTIDYWFISPIPTLIVAYETSSDQGHYCWHADLYEQAKEFRDKTPARQLARITFSKDKVLDATAWDSIRSDLRSHRANMHDIVHSAHDAKYILPAVHALARAARLLNNIDHQPIAPEHQTEEQSGLLAMHEMMQHRLVVCTLTELLDRLVPEAPAAKRIRAWIDSYTSLVKSVFLNFDELPDWKYWPDIGVAFKRKQVPLVRPQLMQFVLEMIMLLAPGQFKLKNKP